MVNNSRSIIPHLEKKNKQYTTHDVKMADFSRKLQKITSQALKQILHVGHNNILHDIPILQEDVGMDEENYVTSVLHLQGKTFNHKVQHVEHIIAPNVPKVILDRYNNATLCCDIMYINGIGLLIIISRHILFAMGKMIEPRKLKNIEDGIKQVNRLYLQHAFKITRIHADSEFKSLIAKKADIGIYLSWV